MKKRTYQNGCTHHPDRIAAVDKRGVFLCWQCYLPPDVFQKRFGPDFYQKESA